MVKSNPMNPHTRGEDETQNDVAPPVAKAEVVQTYGHDPDASSPKGYHTVRVSVYGEDSSFVAPVLTMGNGTAHIPKVGDDVAILYGESEKAWVVGYWYATDGDEPPKYDPGEVVLSNDSGAEVRIDNDGNIHLKTGENGEIIME